MYEISIVLPVIVGICAGLYALSDAGRAPNHKRPVRLFEAVSIYYFVILYLVVLLGNGTAYLWIRNGTVSRIGYSLLLAAIVYDILASSRGKHAARSY